MSYLQFYRRKFTNVIEALENPIMSLHNIETIIFIEKAAGVNEKLMSFSFNTKIKLNEMPKPFQM